MSTQTFISHIGEDETKLAVDSNGDGRYTVEIDGTTHEVDACRLAGGSWSLLIDGESYDVELEVSGEHESEGEYNALVRGHVLHLAVQDERHVRMHATSKKFQVEGPQTLNSPMPGKVVKILVKEGQDVEENEPLVIVEAMKMENELRTPKAGKVSAILVAEGEAVDAGSKLVSVD